MLVEEGQGRGLDDGLFDRAVAPVDHDGVAVEGTAGVGVVAGEENSRALDDCGQRRRGRQVLVGRDDQIGNGRGDVVDLDRRAGVAPGSAAPSVSVPVAVMA